MSVLKLALQNFKSSFKNYLSLIASLGFTNLILCNFINLVYSGILNQLGETNARNVEIILQILSFVIGCFMFFFIWYSINVFLQKRKKEIGIYVFMGLSNQKIGKLYALETIFIGFAALVFGLLFGVITSQLFTMILMRMSEISIEIQFNISLESILMTSIIFAFIYTIFVVKGYINVVRSSVLSMVSANKQNEFVKQRTWLLLVKAVLGIGLVGIGCYLAVKDAGLEVVGNLLIAVVLVVSGIYFIFGGFVPFIFQTLAKNKKFLYQHERNLWINNIIFRMKKNYRTYGMVCILMLCSVTALAFGFAMKNRHDSIVHFENVYTYQIMSDQSGYQSEFSKLIEKNNDIAYQSDIEVTMIDENYTNNKYTTPIAVLPYSSVRKVADDTNLPFELEEPKDNEYIELNRLHVISLMNDSMVNKQDINGVTYTSIDKTTDPYLGYMQENMEYMIVNDQEYQKLQSFGQSMHLYNYKIVDPYQFEKSVDDIQSSLHCLGLVKINPERSDIGWIKILFSVSSFMFLVFVLASGSILFMKIYNDSFEEKERYIVLQKLGTSNYTLKRAVSHELKFAFITPLLIMSVISYFSIEAIGNVMQTTLPYVNILSLCIVYVCFFVFYLLSKAIYIKNTVKE